MALNDKKIVVRPRIIYLFIGLLCIAMGFTIFLGLGQALPSDDQVTTEIVRWSLLLFILIIALYSILFFSLSKIQLDDENISINRFPLKRRDYLWSEITYAKIIDEAFAYPCVIYAGEKKIAKIPRAFIGYEQLLNELDRRNILWQDDLYVEARIILEMDKVKIRDLFRKG